MHAIWRIPAEHLEQAQDDATIVAIRDMERAGIDIVTDGEIRRESYSNRFASALEGIDADNPAMIKVAPGRDPVPRVVGKIRRAQPVEVRDVAFLRRNTDRAAKITLPGPFTLSQQAQERVLRGRRGAGDGLRRRGQRGRAATSSPPASTWSSSTSRGSATTPSMPSAMR